MGYADLDALHAALGEGHISGQALVQRIERDLRGGEGEEQLPSTALQPRRTSHRRVSTGIYVEGLDDVMVRRMRFEFELADPEHLDSLLENLRLLDSVYDAYRLVPGRSDASAPAAR